ncbi:MAG: type II toxin-antitoxin system RelE/ParE family toxin [Saprospiraceae bacterium]|nr:type II toxin-antitoxin system RelE/ParE family toxin [Saprospiraceae bacterium]
MTKYQVVFSNSAHKQFDKLPSNIQKVIILSASGLVLNPRPYGYKKLRDFDVYRVRAGNYRILYEIHDSILMIRVLKLGHRKDVYQ